MYVLKYPIILSRTVAQQVKTENINANLFFIHFPLYDRKCNILRIFCDFNERRTTKLPNTHFSIGFHTSKLRLRLSKYILSVLH